MEIGWTRCGTPMDTEHRDSAKVKRGHAHGPKKVIQFVSPVCAKVKRGHAQGPKQVIQFVSPVCAKVKRGHVIQFVSPVCANQGQTWSCTWTKGGDTICITCLRQGQTWSCTGTKGGDTICITCLRRCATTPLPLCSSFEWCSSTPF